MEITRISLFEGKEIRKTIHNGEWWFSIVDIIEVLTDTLNSRIYWGVMKNRLQNDEKVELFTICKQFKLEAQDGKMRETDCANVRNY